MILSSPPPDHILTRSRGGHLPLLPLQAVALDVTMCVWGLQDGVLPAFSNFKNRPPGSCSHQLCFSSWNFISFPRQQGARLGDPVCW